MRDVISPQTQNAALTANKISHIKILAAIDGKFHLQLFRLIGRLRNPQ
ncbi:hypothetical protein RMSM_06520 [Rhodopirellula maiorica SM1]|uniref:Uncharacterized protein n=1 Tax=Rhodopirellula maiorica SM1 TaxID=1265738 RepID=M5RRG6_9BACT|nr:hypothetical protein RMSM_06520 [Rhodopirellula maiorica SM1]